MSSDAIEIAYMPEMDDPVLIVGFEGWGNALDLSRGMVDYLIEKLDAKAFGRILPDPFYRFDENRPLVEIEEGLLKKITLTRRISCMSSKNRDGGSRHDFAQGAGAQSAMAVLCGGAAGSL